MTQMHRVEFTTWMHSVPGMYLVFTLHIGSKNMMHRHIIKLGLTAALLTLSGLANAQTVTSADDKVWTGAACVPAGGNPWGHYAIRPSGIQNIYSGLRYITCPLPVDSENDWDAYQSTGGTPGDANVRIRLNYSQGGGTTTCTVQITKAGEIIETASSTVNAAQGTASPSVNISGLTQGDGNDAGMAMNCLLPSKVIVSTYNLEEWAVTAPNNGP